MLLYFLFHFAISVTVTMPFAPSLGVLPPQHSFKKVLLRP